MIVIVMKTKISKKSSYKKIWIFHKKELAISYLVPCYEFWWYVACKFIYFVPLLEVCCSAVLFLSIVVCCVVCYGLSVVLVISQLLLSILSNNYHVWCSLVVLIMSSFSANIRALTLVIMNFHVTPKFC